MDTSSQPSGKPKAGNAISALTRRLRLPKSGLGWVILIVAILAGLGISYYQEQNWRGKRAWKEFKTRREAKGALLDWEAFIPPVVPEDQNIFAAPKLAEWFAGQGQNDLTLKAGGFHHYCDYKHLNVMAEVTVISPDDDVPPGKADLVLNLNHPSVSLGTEEAHPKVIPDGTNTAADIALPSIVITDLDLESAIRFLSQQAHLTILFDPSVSPVYLRQAVITSKWEATTARAALLDVLASHSLRAVPGVSPRSLHIVNQNSSGSSLRPTVEADQAIRQWVQKIVAVATNTPPGATCIAALGFPITVNPANPTRPVRIYLRSSEAASVHGLSELIPLAEIKTQYSVSQFLMAEATGSNQFRIKLIGPLRVTAADYLTWSDTLNPELEIIRQGLRRPYTRGEGKYDDFFHLPPQNYVSHRVMAQMLSQRAECHLMLQQPAEALKDLTLLHELNRLMEYRGPEGSGKPMTLISAMMITALSGLYVNTAAEGLRLNAWRGSDLAEIQKQLLELNLPRELLRAFQTEEAGICRFLETMDAKQFNAQYQDKATTNTVEHFLNPGYLVTRFGPRGWVYQNLTAVAKFYDQLFESCDPTGKFVSPSRLAAFENSTKPVREVGSVFTILASKAIPSNHDTAIKSCAHNQTEINELITVCALERYRLAHHQYPATLEAAGKEFLPSIPVDVIGGGPLVYRPTPEGKYVLYSIGWNELDEGGQTASDTPRDFDLKKGDWVWAY